jgi:hypothetical protein
MRLALLLLALASQADKVRLELKLRKGDRFRTQTQLTWKTDSPGAAAEERIEHTIAWEVTGVTDNGAGIVHGRFARFRKTDLRRGAVLIDWEETRPAAVADPEVAAVLRDGIKAALFANGRMNADTKALPLVFHQTDGGLFGSLACLPEGEVRPGDTWKREGRGTRGPGVSSIETTFEKRDGPHAVLKSKYACKEALSAEFALLHAGEGTATFDAASGFPVRSSGRYVQTGKDKRRELTASFDFEISVSRP